MSKYLNIITMPNVTIFLAYLFNYTILQIKIAYKIRHNCLTFFEKIIIETVSVSYNTTQNMKL